MGATGKSPYLSSQAYAGHMSGGVMFKQNDLFFIDRHYNERYEHLFEFFDTLVFNELNLIGCKTWVAGGALREYFLNKEVRTDIDLYFNDDIEFNKAKNWYLNQDYIPFETIIKNLPSGYNSGITFNDSDRNKLMREILTRPIAKIILENDAAIKLEYKNIKIDLVKKYRPTPESTINSFDFTVTMAAITSKRFYHSTSYFLDLLNKNLVIQNYSNPLSTFHRLQKYIKLGFTVSKEDMFELVRQIKSTPMAEINPVEFALDQLENPRGVKEVDKPIRQQKHKTLQEPVYAGTNGYSQNPCSEIFLDDDVPVATPAAPTEPERRGFFENLFPPTVKKESNYTGY